MEDSTITSSSNHNGTSAFKTAVEQLIDAHVLETNELRKIIADNKKKYNTKRDKWRSEKTTLTAEIERLKKDKLELRTMQKKAQGLLDKYRSQLRSQLQDQFKDESEDTQQGPKDEKSDHAPPQSKSTPKATDSTPIADCYIIIGDVDPKKTPKPPKSKTKIETSDKSTPTTEKSKTEKDEKSYKTNQDETPAKGKKDKKVTSPKDNLDKEGNVVIPIDLSIDEPTTPNTSKTKTNNNTNKIHNIRKSSEYKMSSDVDLLDDINATINSTNNLNNNTPTTKPTKTKYNKYNLTPISKDSSSKTKNADGTPTTSTTTTKNGKSSANTSPINSDTDSDLYQKIYDQFSKTTSKKLVDDLDFGDSSSKPTKRILDDLDFGDSSPSSSSKPDATANMPPPTAAPAKKFKYAEVVRNKEERAALPAHECDQCRKFYEALGDGYDRNKMVQYCSRHRARDEIPDTPDYFWQMSFPSSETQE